MKLVFPLPMPVNNGLQGFDSSKQPNQFATGGPWNAIGKGPTYGALGGSASQAVNSPASSPSPPSNSHASAPTGGFDNAPDPPDSCEDTRSGWGTGAGVATNMMTCCTLNSSICNKKRRRNTDGSC